MFNKKYNIYIFLNEYKDDTQVFTLLRSICQKYKIQMLALSFYSRVRNSVRWLLLPTSQEFDAQECKRE